LLAVPFIELTNHAEETVTVVTDWHPIEGHPVYLIAAPPPGKMAPRPLNVPILSLREAPVDSYDEAELKLPFEMSAAQAVRIGNGLIDDADFQMALSYFEHASKTDPRSPDVLLGLAHCYYGLKRDDEALALYKDVIAQNPSLWKVQFNVGRIHLENGRYAQAVEALNIANNLKPDDPDTLVSYGVALSKAGKTAEAIPILKRVTATNRRVKEDFYYLGEAYANKGEWMQAAQEFKQGVELRGLDPYGFFYWATMLFNADKIDEAVEGYQRVRKFDLDASLAGPPRYMAEIYRLRGDAAAALGQYQLLLRKEPNDVEALFQAGYISFKLDQWGQAKDYFRKLVQVDPKHAAGAANLAALEAQYNEKYKGRNEKTQGITLREVVQANPNSLEAHTNLGAQLITEEVYPEAVPVLERAVSLKPDSAAAQYDLGLAQIKTRKFDEAVKSNLKALELKPNWPSAYNNLGLAYAGLNRWEEAATAYREAVRLVPNYSGALFNLGRASIKLGQIPVAKQLMERIKPLNWALQAQLGHEILAAEGTAIVIPAPTPPVSGPVVVSATTPTPTPATQPPTPEPQPTPADGSRIISNPGPSGPGSEKSTPPASADTECPDPIYRPTRVTQMAAIKDQVQVGYTDEAAQNNVEGRIVLRAVFCANGRVADVAIEESLPFGLTERAVEAMKKVQFQPALLDARPVSVFVRQTFSCAQRVCTAVTSP
jgi:TonB family protein